MFLFNFIAALFLYVAVLDLGIIVIRGIHGKQELLKKTILGSLLGMVFKNKSSTDVSKEMPVGDLNAFKVSDRTICMDKVDNRTRLTYFSDADNKYWFKLEKILINGTVVGEPRFEPATMTLQQKSMKFI